VKIEKRPVMEDQRFLLFTAENQKERGMFAWAFGPNVRAGRVRGYGGKSPIIRGSVELSDGTMWARKDTRLRHKAEVMDRPTLTA
jgi:hypothetical protein